ncbi:MAG TPA: hypothetical protein VGK22_13520 [Candidatus Angelobacter sp.]|jgi:hypothetical protein
MRKLVLVPALFLLLPVYLAAQDASPENIFTIKVAGPTLPKDVQVRYFLNGNPAVLQSSSSAASSDNQIVVKTDVEGKAAKSFRAIVYSPGCQFATVRADDLSASNRQSDFQCQKLATTALHGKADVSRFAGKSLQVEALYSCRWAGQFFGVPSLSISPLSVGKVKVENEGDFSLDLPNFTSDPLWATLTNNAVLTLYLVDAQTGERLGRLAAPSDLSRKGALKIAGSYPEEVQFTVR